MRRLTLLEAVPDGGTHVSIRPKDMTEMEDWIATKETANEAPRAFTEELVDAIVETVKVE